MLISKKRKYKDIAKSENKFFSHYCLTLTIGGTSEPLLDERLPDMLALARDSGFMDTMININATLLSKENNI